MAVTFLDLLQARRRLGFCFLSNAALVPRGVLDRFGSKEELDWQLSIQERAQGAPSARGRPRRPKPRALQRRPYTHGQLHGSDDLVGRIPAILWRCCDQELATSDRPIPVNGTRLIFEERARNPFQEIFQAKVPVAFFLVPSFRLAQFFEQAGFGKTFHSIREPLPHAGLPGFRQRFDKIRDIASFYL